MTSMLCTYIDVAALKVFKQAELNALYAAEEDKDSLVHDLNYG